MSFAEFMCWALWGITLVLAALACCAAIAATIRRWRYNRRLKKWTQRHNVTFHTIRDVQWFQAYNPMTGRKEWWSYFTHESN